MRPPDGSLNLQWECEQRRNGCLDLALAVLRDVLKERVRSVNDAAVRLNDDLYLLHVPPPWSHNLQVHLSE